MNEEQKQAVRDAVASALGDAYDCQRIWSAWGVGTMSSNDFSLVAEDDERLNDITDAALAAMPAPFEARVQLWMLACFGAEIAADAQERNHRFLEEALELVQACGATQSEAHQLVDYVYGRPVGDKHQEVGGVMVTLAALCLAQGLGMHEAGEAELARMEKYEDLRKDFDKKMAERRANPLIAHFEQPSAKALALLHDLFGVHLLSGDLDFDFDGWFAIEDIHRVRALLTAELPCEDERDAANAASITASSAEIVQPIEDKRDLAQVVEDAGGWGAETEQFLIAQEDKRDAERYRWLRKRHWNDSTLFVVAGHHSLVRLGTDCPSDERLDEAIDAAMQEQKR